MAMLQELLQGSAILANADGAALRIDSWTSQSSETVGTFLGAKLMRGDGVNRLEKIGICYTVTQYYGRNGE